ncbi:hypothetical protein [Paraburkholderia tagetis]|uniref:HEPN domain-containing protein n=1 Tax=Paraburkholderia tagetis TaxID=2913261 RepID=A0A9X2A160_9BURK|nr:hypothetical protein [Paraburkholderia tagetis]MCG5078799.1 hypothetical protein [Paraburkholderia tagetis]
MTAPTTNAEIRDAIFEHEMFSAGNINSGYLLEGIRHVEATWVFSPTELIDELHRMENEGLVLRRDGFGGDIREYWESTRAGQIAREMRWQKCERRDPALSSQTSAAEDLIIAVIASGGSEYEALSGAGLMAEALGVYLSRWSETVCETTLNALIERGLVRRDDQDLVGWPFRLMLTADGRRRYAHDVVPRLGLRPPATILAPSEHERLPCDDLGLEPALADNLRYRWEEAGRCKEAHAWLAATALYGSILEVVLPDWLGRDIDRARAARAAPLDRHKQVLPLGDWPLAALIKVAVELAFIDESLGRHAQALRESRNLIHPDRQIRERSTPNGDLVAISKRVVHAVLDALARATRACAAASRGDIA